MISCSSSFSEPSLCDWDCSNFFILWWFLALVCWHGRLDWWYGSSSCTVFQVTIVWYLNKDSSTPVFWSFLAVVHSSRWDRTSATVYLCPLSQTPFKIQQVGLYHPGDFPFLISCSASSTSERSGSGSSSVLSGQYVCWWFFGSYSFVLYSIHPFFYFLCFSQCIAILIIIYICSWRPLAGQFFHSFVHLLWIVPELLYLFTLFLYKYSLVLFHIIGYFLIWHV